VEGLYQLWKVPEDSETRTRKETNLAGKIVEKFDPH
jgi:hypothetical protein